MHRVVAAGRGAGAGRLGAGGAPQERQEASAAGCLATAAVSGACEDGLLPLGILQLSLVVGDGVIQLLLEIRDLRLLPSLQLRMLELQVLHLALPLDLFPFQRVLQDITLLFGLAELPFQVLHLGFRCAGALAQLPLHAIVLRPQQLQLCRGLVTSALCGLELLPHVLQSVARDALRFHSKEKLVLQGVEFRVRLACGLRLLRGLNVKLDACGRLFSRLERLRQALHLALELCLSAGEVLLKLRIFDAALRELILQLLDRREELLVGAFAAATSPDYGIGGLGQPIGQAELTSPGRIHRSSSAPHAGNYRRVLPREDR
mmetsp:Transcript_61046/g.176838  ORF Transcript_61046/g.176838 Transcript_61046/m.176838 type:complete len:318 (+) Transcript_61046:621-1574(+)